MKAKRMRKWAMLKYWTAIEPNQSISPEPVPDRHRGSTYGQDSIRVTGSANFCDGVLSRLKDLLSHESVDTRLQVNYQQVTDRETGHPMPDQWAVYIQVHERGRQMGLAMAAMADAK